jgi:hypothetical protein
MTSADLDALTAASYFTHQPQPRWHFADDLRTAVFAGDEEALLRLAAHLQSCPDCQDRELFLVDRLSDRAASSEGLGEVACGPVRASLLRFLEQDRTLTVSVLRHLQMCDACRPHLTEAAFATYITEVHGDGETPAL